MKSRRTHLRLILLLSAALILPFVRRVEAAEPQPTRVLGGATISARLMNELFSRPVQETTPIHTSMMRATTVGTAWTEGQVLAEFLPHADHAIVNIRLVGSMLASNQSRRRRITVRSGSRTSINANKRIIIQPDGLETDDAVANCSTSMWVRSISANSRFVERLAGRRVERQRSEVERTTSSRAAREVESQLNREVAGLMQKLNDGSKGALSEGLPLDIRFQTSDERLFVSLLTTDIARRPGANQGMAAADYDLGFSAHQALLEIALGKLLRGKTVLDSKLLEMVETITGSAPRALWVHDRRARWSLTMADVARPVEVAFDKEGAHVTLIASQLQVGDKKHKTAIRVATDYKLEPTADGPHLIRTGKVRITTPNNPKSADEIQKFLDRKFGAFFQEDLYFDGMVPPVGGSGGKLRRLGLKRLSTSDGWLIMGYQLPAETVAESR